MGASPAVRVLRVTLALGVAALVGASATVHASGLGGHYRGAVMTKDYTTLSPDEVEHKFYTRGVGLVEAMTVAGEYDLEQLIRTS